MPATGLGSGTAVMSSPVLSVVSTLGLVAGQAGELSDRNLALGALGVDGRVEDAHRHGHVARMRGDAGVAAADDRELPALSA